jgi:hypothetical protein
MLRSPRRRQDADGEVAQAGHGPGGGAGAGLGGVLGEGGVAEVVQRLDAPMVQVRRPSAEQAYYQRKLAEGKSPKEALRCLKRRLSDAVYRCLLADRQDAVSARALAAGARPWAGLSPHPVLWKL